jgi:hypothetical protein
MPQVTDNMFSSVIVGAVFLILMAFFNILFITGTLEEQNTPITFDAILGASWAVFAEYPELLIFDAVLGTVGLIISLFVVRELLPA